MHQILSYETAVRANSSREFNEYVTKRTCVSLILSIAFFTLISGYLLGNFVSERKHHIQESVNKNPMKSNNEYSAEFTSDDYAILKEVQSSRKSKDKLLSSAQALSANLPRDENYISLNTKIFNKYISCTQEMPPNTSFVTNQFIEQMVETTMARQKSCIHDIQVFIDSNLAN